VQPASFEDWPAGAPWLQARRALHRDPVRLASELPFALWAVYLGAALIEDRHAAFLLL